MAPPSTYSVWPVMYDASSLHRNAAAAAMSSGWPTRRTGLRSAAAFRNSSTGIPTRAAVASVMSVAMKPGAIALAVTLNLPSSMARVLVKPCMPALAAE